MGGEKGGLCGGLITLGTHACELLFPHLGFVLYHDRCSKNSLLQIVEPLPLRLDYFSYSYSTWSNSSYRTLINVMPACLSYPPPLQCFHFGYHYRIEHPAAKPFFPRHHFSLSARFIQARAWRPHHQDLPPPPAEETAEEEEEEEAPASDSPGLAGGRRARRRPWRSRTLPGRRRQSPGVGRWRRLLPKVVVVWSGVASGCSFHFHFPPPF